MGNECTWLVLFLIWQAHFFGSWSKAAGDVSLSLCLISFHSISTGSHQKFGIRFTLDRYLMLLLSQPFRFSAYMCIWTLISTGLTSVVDVIARSLMYGLMKSMFRCSCEDLVGWVENTGRPRPCPCLTRIFPSQLSLSKIPCIAYDFFQAGLELNDLWPDL